MNHSLFSSKNQWLLELGVFFCNGTVAILKIAALNLDSPSSLVVEYFIDMISLPNIIVNRKRPRGPRYPKIILSKTYFWHLLRFRPLLTVFERSEKHKDDTSRDCWRKRWPEDWSHDHGTWQSRSTVFFLWRPVGWWGYHNLHFLRYWIAKNVQVVRPVGASFWWWPGPVKQCWGAVSGQKSKWLLLCLQFCDFVAVETACFREKIFESLLLMGADVKTHRYWQHDSCWWIGVRTYCLCRRWACLDPVIDN